MKAPRFCPRHIFFSCLTCPYFYINEKYTPMCDKYESPVKLKKWEIGILNKLLKEADAK